MLKLGSKGREVASNLVGSLTHLCVDMSGHVYYVFQPAGLTVETQQPLKPLWVPEARLTGFPQATDEVKIPMQLLGSIAEDDASGFKGMVTGLTLHINGCIHAEVQPQGLLEKSGEMIKPQDFDIRRLKGDKVPVMTEPERKADQAARPSPAPVPAMRGCEDDEL